ncbi:probable G-protein coupled receptor 139 [Narcine bancroftii]|uniref:probable G-protein coupled receptor 139 n=1 Tax=Narcine bancroftii TaxID=1343680 RepID=UPI003830FD7E
MDLGNKSVWRTVFPYFNYITSKDSSLEWRMFFALRTIQPVYYPILAIFAVPVNSLTLVVLSRRKCGLSKGITCYLVAMTTADLLVVFLDLISRHIVIVFRNVFLFLSYMPACNIHAILLYAATDCSVWFTVGFTFDRFVGICCQKLQNKYCTERTAVSVVGTVIVFSCLKNIFWYFMMTGDYTFNNNPHFCEERDTVLGSREWATVQFLHYIITPFLPFVLVLLFNGLTVRYVLASSRARKRFRRVCRGDSPTDPEVKSRRKSLILLLVISGNFILFWAVLTAYFIWFRIYWAWFRHVDNAYPPFFVKELGFMLQVLNYSTNSALYTGVQTKFREQLEEVMKYPFILIIKFIQRRQHLRIKLSPFASKIICW